MWLKQCHKRTIPQDNHHVYRCYINIYINHAQENGWFIIVLSTLIINTCDLLMGLNSQTKYVYQWGLGGL